MLGMTLTPDPSPAHCATSLAPNQRGNFFVGSALHHDRISGAGDQNMSDEFDDAYDDESLRHSVMPSRIDQETLRSRVAQLMARPWRSGPSGSGRGDRKGVATAGPRATDTEKGAGAARREGQVVAESGYTLDAP
jgi:hypothetical protein